MPPDTVTIILPTYREADSLPDTLDALSALRDADLPEAQVIIVDDDSQDGTEALIEERGEDWVRLIVRREDRGLSSAVLHGLEEATGDVLVIMDADGSHPASVIPAMVKALSEGADFVVGSRYVPGGSTEDGWGVLRWLNSKAATLMARVFTRVRDPMSGFLGLRRATWERAVDLDPIGYKIGLELIVKCGCKSVAEVPIGFRTRRHGQSKLTLKVQWEYLLHCIRLYRYTHPSHVSFFTFAAVGASGVAIYLAALMLWTAVIPAQRIAIALAVLTAMSWNFTWDRRWAFWYARRQSLLVQYLGFIAVCSVGAIATWAVTMWLSAAHGIPWAGLVGASVGSAVGITFNFLVSRYLVFKR